MDVLQPGEHGSTFGGNPLACAIARTVKGFIDTEASTEAGLKMIAQKKISILPVHDGERTTCLIRNTDIFPALTDNLDIDG